MNENSFYVNCEDDNLRMYEHCKERIFYLAQYFDFKY